MGVYLQINTLLVIYKSLYYSIYEWPFKLALVRLFWTLVIWIDIVERETFDMNQTLVTLSKDNKREREI